VACQLIKAVLLLLIIEAGITVFAQINVRLSLSKNLNSSFL